MTVSSAVDGTDDGAFLDVKVTASSDAAAFPEDYDRWRDVVTVRVTAPPTDGQANAELVAAAKGFFEADVEIAKGHREPRKRLWIGRSADDVVARIEEVL